MSLASLCSEVLDAIVDYAADISYDLPASQVVRAGTPAWTCEEIAVWIEALNAHGGDVLAGATTVFQPEVGLRAAVLVVSVVRCAALARMVDKKLIQPSPAEHLAVAELVANDADTVDQAMQQAELVGCNSFASLGWRVSGPQGQFVAGEWRYIVGTDSLDIDDGS